MTLTRLNPVPPSAARTARRRLSLALSLVLATLGLGLVAAPAGAAAPEGQWSCRATSLDLSTGPIPLDGLLDPIESLLATGDDDATCRTSTGSPVGEPLNQIVSILRPLGIDLGALETTTSIESASPPDQSPEAHAKVADLNISLLGVADLVTADAVEADVRAACIDGRPTYTSTYGVAGLRVFGQAIVLDDAVRTISGALGPLGPVVRLTPGALDTSGDGHARSALRIEVLNLGIPLLDLQIATARIGAGGVTCGRATANAPTVEGRTISADVTPTGGATVTSCSFTVTPPGGTATTVAGTVGGDRCTAELPRAEYPPADGYSATTTVEDSLGRTSTSPSAPFDLAAPTAGTPTINGRVISSVVTPGAGATFAADACELTIAKAGEPASPLAASLVTDSTSGVQRCEASLPAGGFPAGDYAVTTKVTDSLGDSAESEGTVTTGGPSLGDVVLDGRTVRASITAGASPVASCSFQVTRQATGSTPAGTTVSVPGTLNGAKDRCEATLPPAEFPAGIYDIVAVAVDEAGDSGHAAGAGTIAGPTVGDVALDGRELTVAEVRPGSGATIDEDRGCRVVLTPVGGGTETVVPATYDAAQDRCVAELPEAFAGGAYDVTTTVTDSAGDTAIGSGRVTVVGGPAVGTPEIDGRTVSATVDPAAGRTVASCSFAVTPADGGTTTEVPGTFDAGRCTANLPQDAFPAGTYAVVATALDDAGYRGQATGSGTVSGDSGPEEPRDAVVGPPTIDGRVVTAVITDPGTSPVTGCTMTVTPAGGGDPIAVDAKVEGGACVATLPREQFPPGDYVVEVAVTQENGGVAGSNGPVTVAGPTVGTPVAVGPAIAVPVAPGPGATIEECTFVVTPAGGGETKTVPGVYDAAAAGCATVLPADAFPTGEYDVVVTVKDSHGDTATGGARVLVQQAGPVTGGGRDTTAGEVAQRFLACEGGTLAIVDVRPQGRRARVAGVALQKLAGRTVSIQLYEPGKKRRTVGTARVSADGRFTKLVSAPRKPHRRTRYRAVIDGKASRTLRLLRRTSVTAVSERGGRVTISGRVSKPYSRGAAPVWVQRRVGCTKHETVARSTMRRNGRFTFTFTAPKGEAFLYRVQTSIASRPNGPARGRSFSLPQIVEVR